jgi:DNA polymerase III sliding clamp (beta) subunit (PCNA family)
MRSCRICGCTEQDCRQCIEKTGGPCHWVEKDLCSACVEEASLIIQSHKTSKMKFTTETNNLKEALQRLGFAVNSKSVMPVLGSMLATIQKGTVLLTTTDLMVTINFLLECETEGEGQFLIPYQHLKNIVALETGNVSIEWGGDTIGAIAKFDHDVFKLGMHGVVTDFPKIPTVNKKGMLEVNNEFIGALKMAALGVSKDDNRPVCHNICIELNKDGVSVTSTDTFTIYTQRLELATEVEEKTELLVPSVVAKVLDGFDSTKIGFNKNHAAFESGPVLITCKRGEGIFPAWRNVMPAHDSNVTVKIEDLRSSVEKAYVMSDATFNGIDFMISDNQVELIAEEKDSGMSCSVKIPATSGSPIKHLRFSGRFLKRMITQLERHSESDGDVSFSIQSEKKVTVQAFGKSNVTVLLVPIARN